MLGGATRDATREEAGGAGLSAGGGEPRLAAHAAAAPESARPATSAASSRRVSRMSQDGGTTRDMRRSTPPGGDAGADPGSRRRRAAALAGHRGDEGAARALVADPEPAVRATALAALARMGRATGEDLRRGLLDADPGVRRRACEVAGRLAASSGATHVVVHELALCLADREPVVVEAAAWGLGEHGAAAATAPALDALAAVATSHADPLCREAAVAALGAVG